MSLLHPIAPSLTDLLYISASKGKPKALAANAKQLLTCFVRAVMGQLFFRRDHSSQLDSNQRSKGIIPSTL